MNSKKDPKYRGHNFSEELSPLRLNTIGNEPNALNTWKQNKEIFKESEKLKDLKKEFKEKKFNLRGANFSHLELEEFDFSGFDLEGANFSNTRLINVKFDNSAMGITRRRQSILWIFCLLMSFLSGLICSFSICGFAIFAFDPLTIDRLISLECGQLDSISEVMSQSSSAFIQQFLVQHPNFPSEDLLNSCKADRLTDLFGVDLEALKEKYKASKISKGILLQDLTEEINRENTLGKWAVATTPLFFMSALLSFSWGSGFISFLWCCIVYIFITLSLIVFAPNMTATITMSSMISCIGICFSILAMTHAYFLHSRLRNQYKGLSNEFSIRGRQQSNLRITLMIILAAAGVYLGVLIGSGGARNGFNALENWHFYLIISASITVVVFSCFFSKNVDSSKSKFRALKILFMLAFSGAMTSFRNARFYGECTSFEGAVVKAADFSFSSKGPSFSYEEKIARLETLRLVASSSEGGIYNYYEDSTIIGTVNGPVAVNGDSTTNGDVIVHATKAT